MVQAIGSSTIAIASNSGSTAAVLEAQLSKYQKQLSDCVNCDSSETDEGKAQIQELSAKISSVRERIAKITNVSSAELTNALMQSTSTNPKPINIVAKAANENRATESTTSKIVIGTVGNFLDIQA